MNINTQKITEIINNISNISQEKAKIAQEIFNYINNMTMSCQIIPLMQLVKKTKIYFQ